MSEFVVLGNTFIITQQQENFVVVANYFSSIREKAVNSFLDDYTRNYPDPNNWEQDTCDILRRILRNASNQSVNYLRKNGVYTVSEDYFYNQGFESRYIEKVILDISERLGNIEGKANADIEYRELRKQNRSKALGFGFGLSGYVKGSMEAGLINATTGLGHSIINGIGNAATSSMATSEMNSVIKSNETIVSLSKMIQMTIYDMQASVIQILNHDSDVKCQVISIEDELKSDAIIDSLKHLNKEEQKRALIQALNLNVLCTAAYEFIIINFPEERHNADKMASHFGIDVSGIIKDSINEKISFTLNYIDQFELFSLTPYKAINNIYAKVEMIEKELKETEWDEDLAIKRLPELHKLRYTVESIAHTFMGCDFGGKEELFKAALELEQLYHDVSTVDLLDEIVYMDIKIHLDKYEFLNIYHYQILYKAIDILRDIQSIYYNCSIIGELIRVNNLDSKVCDMFLFEGNKSDFEKRSNQVKKIIPMNNGEKILCIFYSGINQAICFTSTRVMIFDHLLAKKHIAIDIKDANLFCLENGNKIRLIGKTCSSEFTIPIEEASRVEILIRLNAILNIINAYNRNEIICENSECSVKSPNCIEESKLSIEDINNYILNNFTMETKLQAISYYREKTGSDLKSSKAAIENLLSQPVKTKMFCPFCGNEILRVAKFCNFCGKENNYK